MNQLMNDPLVEAIDRQVLGYEPLVLTEEQFQTYQKGFRQWWDSWHNWPSYQQRLENGDCEE